MPPDHAQSGEFATSGVRPKTGAKQLVRDHAGWMLVLAERVVNDSALAEDVVQEAMINALKGLDRFEKKSSFKTWLHRITVNMALSKRRKHKRLAEQSIDELLPSSTGSTAESNDRGRISHRPRKSRRTLKPGRMLRTVFERCRTLTELCCSCAISRATTRARRRNFSSCPRRM